MIHIRLHSKYLLHTIQLNHSICDCDYYVGLEQESLMSIVTVAAVSTMVPPARSVVCSPKLVALVAAALETRTLVYPTMMFRFSHSNFYMRQIRIISTSWTLYVDEIRMWLIHHTYSQSVQYLVELSLFSDNIIYNTDSICELKS